MNNKRRNLDNFVCCQLNIIKTKELIVDFCKTKPPLTPVFIRLEGAGNMDALFLQMLRIFNVYQSTMFYQSVVASVIFYAAVCW